MHLTQHPSHFRTPAGVSAYVPGLPVYAAADSHARAERAIRVGLTEYLNAGGSVNSKVDSNLQSASLSFAPPAAGPGARAQLQALRMADG
jgi:hypothetical protein